MLFAGAGKAAGADAAGVHRQGLLFLLVLFLDCLLLFFLFVLFAPPFLVLILVLFISFFAFCNSVLALAA